MCVTLKNITLRCTEIDGVERGTFSKGKPLVTFNLIACRSITFEVGPCSYALRVSWKLGGSNLGSVKFFFFQHTEAPLAIQLGVNHLEGPPED